MPPKKQDFTAQPGTEDFIRQAKEYTLDGAKGVLRTLKARRKEAVKLIDEEISFVENVITYKEDQV